MWCNEHNLFKFIKVCVHYTTIIRIKINSGRLWCNSRFRFYIHSVTTIIPQIFIIKLIQRNLWCNEHNLLKSIKVCVHYTTIIRLKINSGRLWCNSRFRFYIHSVTTIIPQCFRKENCRCKKFIDYSLADVIFWRN